MVSAIEVEKEVEVGDKVDKGEEEEEGCSVTCWSLKDRAIF
jgi:hypothetical protein